MERSSFLGTAAVTEKSFRGDFGVRILLCGGGNKVLQEGTEEKELGVSCCSERWTQPGLIFAKDGGLKAVEVEYPRCLTTRT